MLTEQVDSLDLEVKEPKKHLNQYSHNMKKLPFIVESVKPLSQCKKVGR